MSQSPPPTTSRKNTGKANPSREETDNDEMEQDSDSEKSSSDSERSSTEDESSSDMDEADLDRRRTECLETLADLERQFNITKEQLFREKCTQVDDKLFEIRSGRGQEYLSPLQQLQENMRIRTEVASILKQYSIDSVLTQVEAETLAAHQNLQSELKLLIDEMQEELENEIRRLEEDRNNIDVSSALCGSEEKKPKKSLMRQKQVTVSGPYIIYMLSDAEILSDLTVIKKALTASRRKSSVQ